MVLTHCHIDYSRFFSYTYYSTVIKLFSMFPMLGALVKGKYIMRLVVSEMLCEGPVGELSCNQESASKASARFLTRSGSTVDRFTWE